MEHFALLDHLPTPRCCSDVAESELASSLVEKRCGKKQRQTAGMNKLRSVRSGFKAQWLLTKGYDSAVIFL